MARKRGSQTTRRSGRRASWTGNVGFGFLSFPVKMYSAVREHKLHFNYLHAPDDGRIGYSKYCKQEGKPVPDSEIVRAFEVEKGEWVHLSEEDFEAAEQDGLRELSIEEFVPVSQVDPSYFENTYYLEPDEDAARAYVVLVQAMEEAGLAAVCKIVMREREHLALLRVKDGLLLVERMHFADELRPLEEARAPKANAASGEVAMATRLIESLRTDFEPSRYQDTYREALCDVIRAKQAGEEPEPPAEERTAFAGDLMEALRRSMAEVESRRERVSA